jgi:predicted aconitase with swiveling domain
MSREFKGRAILPGSLEGEALVTYVGFNSLACFYQSMLTGATAAICSDQGNPQLFRKNLSDRVVCLPKTVGSTSAGATWDRVAYMGIAPKAMLFSEPIDSLAAAGLILADIWVGKRIYTVDRLGDEFLACVKDGDRIVIEEDGTVTIEPIQGESL